MSEPWRVFLSPLLWALWLYLSGRSEADADSFGGAVARTKGKPERYIPFEIVPLILLDLSRNLPGKIGILMEKFLTTYNVHNAYVVHRIAVVIISSLMLDVVEFWKYPLISFCFWSFIPFFHDGAYLSRRKGLDQNLPDYYSFTGYSKTSTAIFSFQKFHIRFLFFVLGLIFYIIIILS